MTIIFHYISLYKFFNGQNSNESNINLKLSTFSYDFHAKLPGHTCNCVDPLFIEACIRVYKCSMSSERKKCKHNSHVELTHIAQTIL